MPAATQAAAIAATETIAKRLHGVGSALPGLAFAIGLGLAAAADAGCTAAPIAMAALPAGADDDIATAGGAAASVTPRVLCNNSQRLISCETSPLR